jgi:PAS domain S-box-containing protein
MKKRAFRLLLIEDNPGDARLVKEALTEGDGEPFRLDWATNLAAGLTRLNNTPFDVVLLDLSLPDCSGLSTFEQIYTVAPQTPIILLTGLDDQDLAHQLIRQGAQDYLIKGDCSGRMLDRLIRHAIERKQAEESLQTAFLKWQTTFDSSGDGFCLLDSEQRILQVNRAMAQLCKAEPEQLIGRHCWEVVHGIEQPLAECPIKRMNKSQRRESMELKTEGRIFEVTVDPLLNQTGKLTGAVHIIRDITERKSMEETLRESEIKFRQTFDLSPVGIVMVGLDKKFLRCNHAFSQSLGYQPEELTERTIADITYPEDREIGMTDMTAIVKGELSSSHVQKRYLHREGHVIWGEVTISLLRDYKGQPQYFLGIIQDITERKRSENILRETSEHLSHMIVNSPTVIYALKVENSRAVPVWISGNITPILGFNPEDPLRPEWWSEQIDPQDRPQALAGLEHLFDDFYQCDYRFICKDGRLIWLHDEHRLLRDADGKPREIIGVWTDITEHKRAEEALQESAAKLKALVEILPVGISVLDAERNISFMNSALETIMDISREDLIKGAYKGRTYLRSNGTPKPMEELASVRAVKEQKAVYNVETGIVKESGDVIWTNVSAVPVLFSDWKVVVVTSEITERKKAEEALQESQEQFRIAQDMSPDGFTILQPVRNAQKRVIDFTWVYENAAIARLNGTDPEAVVGRRLLELFPGHRDTPLLRAYQQVAESGETCIFEADYSGESMPKPTSFRIVVVPMAGNIAILAQNITERKLAENALRESQAFYHSLVEQLPAGVFHKDPDGRYVFVSPWFCGQKGMKAEELLGKTSQEAADFETTKKKAAGLAGKYAATGEEHHRQILQTGEPVEIDEEYTLGGGGKQFIHAIKMPVKDPDGKIIGTQGILFDVTELKLAEKEILKLNTELEARVIERTAQLEAVNQELESFNYSISHDLRAPLRAINGFAQIIKEDYADKLDEAGNELLDTVRASASKMDQLINDLLELSRTGHTELTWFEVDMTTLADSIYHEATRPEVRQTFDFSVAPLPPAYGDPTLLRQVWVNLISNAVKFTMPKKKRRIEIGGYSEPDGNVYYVKDNGAGFNPAYIEKLFVIFQRLHAVEEFEGTGVGLAIVKRIIERHGGRVWAEGKEGKGATFFFALPKKKN